LTKGVGGFTVDLVEDCLPLPVRLVAFAMLDDCD
jgi:hypothetical protein